MATIFTHVCPRTTDDRGTRTGGCGKGWTSARPVDICSTCGRMAQPRGSYRSIELRRVTDDR